MSSVALAIAVLAGLGAVVPQAAAGTTACPLRLDAMIAAAYPDAVLEEHGRYRFPGPDRSFHLGSVACGPIPGTEGLTAILVPIGHEEGDGWLDTIGDLEVLVFEEGSGAPRHRVLEEGLTSEDAYSVSSIGVDPLHYELAGPMPVFGVLMQRATGSRSNPGSVSTLRLYRIAEGRLEAIVTNLAIRQSHSEWNSTCEGKTEDTRRDLLVADSGAGGHADLVIVGRTERTVSTGRAEPCKEMVEVIREERVVLTFDERSYPVPEALRGFDDSYYRR